jgi:hypothetical protein
MHYEDSYPILQKDILPSYTYYYLANNALFTFQNRIEYHLFNVQTDYAIQYEMFSFHPFIKVHQLCDSDLLCIYNTLIHQMNVFI